MYFLLDFYNNPAAIRTMYFAMLIRDIIFTVVPIGLILMVMIDFSKAVITGKEEEQTKKILLIPKRIMYAAIVFCIPWVVDLFLNILKEVKFQVAVDYEKLIANTKSGNFEYYDHLQELEDEAEANRPTTPTSPTPSPGHIDSSIESVWKNNLKQSDPQWGSHPLRYVGKDRTISSAGCGFCAVTMVLRTFGYDLLPPDVVDRILADGYGNSGHAAPIDFVHMADVYGLKSKVYGNYYSKEQAAKEFVPLLKQGKRLIVNMPGHYISVLGIDENGYLYVGDSSRRFWKRGEDGVGPFTMEELFTATVNDGSSYHHWLNVTVIWKE